MGFGEKRKRISNAGQCKVNGPVLISFLMEVRFKPA